MAFIEHNAGGLIYMSSTLIPVPHAFTTRYGGVSRGYLASLNLGANRGDEEAALRENYTRLAALMGVGPDDMAITKQVHGKEVRIVTDADRHKLFTVTPYEADGIATAQRGLPLVCLTADCVPVLLCDAEHGVAAAVHCGWKSSVADILGEAMSRMQTLGAEPGCVTAALGPAIGRCCFETDDDVPQAVTKYLDGDTEGLFDRRADGKTMVDLRAANARRLIRLGVPAEQIDISQECTFCSHEKYWSHRYTKGQRGSQGAVICLPEE